MARFLPDTSVIVAAVCGWHVHHPLASQELSERLDQGQSMAVAAPAVIEAYSVLTRLPAPYRLAAADALALLDENFLGGEVVTLDAAGYRDLLRSAGAATSSFVGGQIYDAVIVACAKVDALLTFNARHFERLARGDLAIVVPQ